MRVARLLALCALTTACAPTARPPADVAMNRADMPAATVSTSGAQAPRAMPQRASMRSNAEIAQDFLDLEFRMESGRALPVLTRFEGPVTVRLTGQVPGTAPNDLSRLVSRIRSEAGIDLTTTTGPANITVEFLPRRTIRAAHANVACFVAPRVSSWAEYKAARGTGQLDWTTLTKRDRVAIFAPADSSPQEVRDCLHEEVAQALGPLNDLFHLPDSVFNDDNFNVTLTGFDMLMLRLHYAPELRSGMTQPQVAAVLPGLLARMNPAGAGTARSHQGGRTPPAWVKAMESALGPRGGSAGRLSAAQNALAIAHAQGWRDSRLAFSWFAVGRLSVGSDPMAASRAFAEAARIYRSLPGAHVHAAHVDMQMAALALSQGDATRALQMTDRALPVVRAAENASLLATVQMLKAEALALQGRAAEAEALRLDTEGVARYGFGADSVVRARMRDISALVPAMARLTGRG